jgi:hypothetical protein
VRFTVRNNEPTGQFLCKNLKTINFPKPLLPTEIEQVQSIALDYPFEDPDSQYEGVGSTFHTEWELRCSYGGSLVGASRWHSLPH